MKSMVYMRHTISYEGNTPTITPTRDKCDAIRRVEKLSTVKDVRAFCGMVNYLSMYLKGLQELLVPLHALLNKGAKWKWTDECQKALDTIRKMLIKPPVLVMPNLTGKFMLVHIKTSHWFGIISRTARSNMTCCLQFKMITRSSNKV